MTVTPAIELAGSEVRERAVDDGRALDIYWDGTSYVVVLPKGKSSLDPSVIIDLDVPGPIRTVTAHVRQNDIDEVMRAVADLAQAHRESFVSYFDVYSGMIVVEGPASFRATILDTHPDTVTYVTVDTGLERLADRTHDREPYSGGAWLTDNRFFPDLGSTCSSGFGLKKNDIEYMVTAGHCKEVGAVYWTKDGATYGQVEFRKFGNQQIDAELIGDYDYGTKVYDGANITHSAFVDGGGNPFVGVTYCSSGAVTWQQCNKQAEATNVQACDAGGICTIKLVRFTNGGGLNFGDSGGPFYYRLNAACVAARGTLVGFDGAGKGYAQMWPSITTGFNGTIIAHDCFGT